MIKDERKTLAKMLMLRYPQDIALMEKSFGKKCRSSL